MANANRAEDIRAALLACLKARSKPTHRRSSGVEPLPEPTWTIKAAPPGWADKVMAKPIESTLADRSTFAPRPPMSDVHAALYRLMARESKRHAVQADKRLRRQSIGQASHPADAIKSRYMRAAISRQLRTWRLK